jgi:hypothetical protein
MEGLVAPVPAIEVVAPAAGFGTCVTHHPREQLLELALLPGDRWNDANAVTTLSSMVVP